MKHQVQLTTELILEDIFEVTFIDTCLAETSYVNYLKETFSVDPFRIVLQALKPGIKIGDFET